MHGDERPNSQAEKSNMTTKLWRLISYLLDDTKYIKVPLPDKSNLGKLYHTLLSSKQDLRKLGMIAISLYARRNIRTFLEMNDLPVLEGKIILNSTDTIHPKLFKRFSKALMLCKTEPACMSGLRDSFLHTIDLKTNTYQRIHYSDQNLKKLLVDESVERIADPRYSLVWLDWPVGDLASKLDPPPPNKTDQKQPNRPRSAMHENLKSSLLDSKFDETSTGQSASDLPPDSNYCLDLQIKKQSNSLKASNRKDSTVQNQALFHPDIECQMSIFYKSNPMNDNSRHLNHKFEPKLGPSVNIQNASILYRIKAGTLKTTISILKKNKENSDSPAKKNTGQSAESSKQPYFFKSRRGSRLQTSERLSFNTFANPAHNYSPQSPGTKRIKFDDSVMFKEKLTSRPKSPTTIMSNHPQKKGLFLQLNRSQQTN